MRRFACLATVLTLAFSSAASAADPLRQADQALLDRAAALSTYETGIAAWMWTDKIWYGFTERISARITVKTYGEKYPFTLVAYLQNNQTGEKLYFPAFTDRATDIFGKQPGEFTPVVITDAEREPLLGEGGLLGGALDAPAQPGMHTLVLEFRDWNGLRVLKTLYAKFAVVSDIVDITGNIESDRRLTNDKLYRINGTVFVRNGATLTIDPGTVIIGQPGSEPPSVLVVTRNGKIRAEGTRSRPIIMTSALPPGERKRGDWGGLILLGRAPVNVAGGEFNIEGLPATEDSRYGGNDPDHDCGTLRYVRVEYAGSIFAPNNEANSFTFGACGRKTVAEYLQAIYGLDDSFEWFGGTMNARYLIGGLGADDYLDWQLGYTGNIQFGFFYQDADNPGNRGIEADNSEFDQGASPLSRPVVYNVTFIGSGVQGFDEANSPGIYLRRGSGGIVNNAIVTRFYSTGLHIDGAATEAQIDNGNIAMNGILLWKNNIGGNGADTIEGQIRSGASTQFALGQRGQGRQFLVADPMLRRPFEVNDPDFRPLPESVVFRAGWIQPPDNGFFDQSARFLGAAGETKWWEEWTNFVTDKAIKP
ncbi:MAG: hypothetical protein ACP5VC_00365 [Bryobacteraceae bacterium]